jgi:outer membrane protein assembly factor BamB
LKLGTPRPPRLSICAPLPLRFYYSRHGSCRFLFAALARVKIPLWLKLIALALLFTLSARAESFLNTNFTTVDLDLYTDSSPAMDANGVLYLSTWQGRIIALNTNGTIHWSFRTAFEMKSSPAIGADGSIYVGARNRYLYALSSTGKKKWTFKTGGWVDSSPAIATNGDVYFGSWDRKFYALSPDGKKKWEFGTDGEIDSSAAIATDGTIYFGSHDKKFYALNPDGTKRWEFPTGGQIISSPAIGAHGEIYFTSVDGKLYALNPDGKKIWSTATGGTTESSPIIGPEGNLYLGVNSNYCAFASDGKKLWSFTIWQYFPSDFVRSTGAIGADGVNYFGSDDQRFWAIEPGGQWKWHTWLAARMTSAPILGADGTAYVLNRGYRFFMVQGAAPLAKTPWPMFRADPQHTGRVQIVR